MRRPAPTLPISLKQLKHFAAATVAITTLLALFAGGDDIGVAAQIDATQAKNDLIAAEQKKLGTKQLATHMKVKSAVSGFGEESDGGFGTGGGGGGATPFAPSRGGPASARPQGPAFLPPVGLADRPDGKLVRKKMASARPGNGKSDGREGESGDADNSAERPDTSQLGNAIEASRQRSGSASANGD